MNDTFNIDLIIPDRQGNDTFRLLGEVTKPNIFLYGKDEFDPDGLYSDEIFGAMGTKDRNVKPGYISLKVPIYHPLIYKTILSLKTLYKNIIEGKTKVKFDENERDFVIDPDGDTGFEFFIKNFDKIELHDNDSDQRRHKIMLIDKYRGEKNLVIKWIVIPAGLRDYSVNKKGQPEEDEINGLYRNLLFATNVLNAINTNSNLKSIDSIRLKIQNSVVAIYDYLQTLIDGKSKFIQEKWSKRAVTFGTRNVLTPSPILVNDLNSENVIEFNDTVVGLLQFIKGIQPVVIGKIRAFLSGILDNESNRAVLVNKKTLRSELTEISNKERDAWLSTEGLGSTINKLLNRDIMMSPISFNDNYYLLLIYDDGRNIRIVSNNDYQGIDKNYVRPITYIELFYLAVYDVRKKYPATVTRYPITGLGSIYPTNIYLKTTTDSRTVTFKTGYGDMIVYEYPILNKQPISGMSVHPSRISRLGADLTFRSTIQ